MGIGATRASPASKGNGGAIMAQRSHERDSVATRLSAIENALAEIHQGKRSDIAEWRRLLLEKESLQEKLDDRKLSQASTGEMVDA